jgi:hypothetical protein
MSYPHTYLRSYDAKFFTWSGRMQKLQILADKLGAIAHHVRQAVAATSTSKQVDWNANSHAMGGLQSK